MMKFEAEKRQHRCMRRAARKFAAKKAKKPAPEPVAAPAVDYVSLFTDSDTSRLVDLIPSLGLIPLADFEACAMVARVK